MKLLALQLILWMISSYHVLMGLGAFLSEAAAERLARAVFDIRLDLQPQSSYLVKLLGVYVILFGLLAGTAAVDPEQSPLLLDLVVLLYVLRILNKIFYRKLFRQAFDASPHRVWIDVALLAAFGGSVFLLRP